MKISKKEKRLKIKSKEGASSDLSEVFTLKNLKNTFSNKSTLKEI